MLNETFSVIFKHCDKSQQVFPIIFQPIDSKTHQIHNAWNSIFSHNEGSNGSNNGSAISNNISNHLTRCFSSSHCCKPNSPPTHNHRGASPRLSSGLPEDCCEDRNGTETEPVNNTSENRITSTHRNCGCDSDHHSHRRKFQRVNKASTTPTNQVEQVRMYSFLLFP